ncbi:hypothetical protein OHT77_15205 [Streptomyces sp. NBC_00252]|uniref:hypothetical protein n=1 Tax=Streptomyces sp. NBC_00252 TaxID=2975691 RepID=UPI002E2A03BE|nr:hypothetical protein [Streptomyces sp. NBC_00252]
MSVPRHEVLIAENVKLAFGYLTERDITSLARAVEGLAHLGLEFRSVQQVSQSTNTVLLRHTDTRWLLHVTSRLRLQLATAPHHENGCTFLVVGLDGVNGSLAELKAKRARGKSHRIAPRPALRATGLAAALAGSRRPHLMRDWSAVLAGSPDDGVKLTPLQQYCLALGFLCAAVHMRVRDLARPLWRPVDWLLRKSSRTNGFIATLVGAQAIYIVGDDGLVALVAEVWEPCTFFAAALYGLSRWLRHIRGIVPDESASKHLRADD